MGGNQFSKECKDCHKQIIMQKTDAGWRALNTDFTPHNCKSGSKAPASSTLSSTPNLIGKITEYTPTNVVIGKKQIFIVHERRDITKADHPAGTVVRVWYENGTLAKMERASSEEIEKYCPEEVAGQKPQPPDPPKETCTSPKAEPAQQQTPTAIKKDEWSDEREEFCNLLASTGREGIQGLIQYLVEKTDFFIAPSSTKYHDARDGGLLHHSLTTYHNLLTLSKTFTGDYPADSLIIIGLLHDICKANFYKTSTRNVKKELAGGLSEWVKEPYIDIDDQFPLGHGEKSAILLLRYIALTDTEVMAIRWHMMAYDDIRCSYAGNLAITNACGKFPIIVLTHIADLSASFLEMRPAESGVN